MQCSPPTHSLITALCGWSFIFRIISVPRSAQFILPQTDPFFALKNDHFSSFIATEGSCHGRDQKKEPSLQGCSAESLFNYLSIWALWCSSAPLSTALYCTRLSQPDSTPSYGWLTGPVRFPYWSVYCPGHFSGFPLSRGVESFAFYKTSWWYIW